MTALDSCLPKLTDKQLELIDERSTPGHTLEQHAANLGRSAGSLRIALHRIRDILKTCVEKTLQLDHGRAFFHVPTEDGKGFTVVTPHQRIVDLGTAFGVDSRLERDTVELHVFEGRVRVDNRHGSAGDIVTAPRSVLLAGARIDRNLDGPPTVFRRKLPAKVETLLREDFESGLVGGRDYAVQIDPTAIRDLEGNRFPGIDDDTTWNFATLPTPAAIPISNPSFEERIQTPEGYLEVWMIAECRSRGVAVAGIDLGGNMGTPNLSDWYGSGGGPVDGPTVSFVPNTVGTTTTVTATASEELEQLFLRAGVMQH